jgi:hypothetical protein
MACAHQPYHGMHVTWHELTDVEIWGERHAVGVSGDKTASVSHAAAGEADSLLMTVRRTPTRRASTDSERCQACLLSPAAATDRDSVAGTGVLPRFPSLRPAGQRRPELSAALVQRGQRPSALLLSRKGVATASPGRAIPSGAERYSGSGVVVGGRRPDAGVSREHEARPGTAVLGCGCASCPGMID